MQLINPKQEKVVVKPKKKEQGLMSEQWKDPNDYRHYIKPLDYSIEESGQPKHRYTIHIQKAVFSDEVFNLYLRYEAAVHGKNNRNK